MQKRRSFFLAECLDFSGSEAAKQAGISSLDHRADREDADQVEKRATLLKSSILDLLKRENASIKTSVVRDMFDELEEDFLSISTATLLREDFEHAPDLMERTGQNLRDAYLRIALALER